MQKKLIFALILIFIPILLVFGVLYKINFGIVSTVVIMLSMLPFFMQFENKKPKARDIVPIAVMAAVAVASRLAFAFIPQFKPIIAVVIVTAVVFGAESGFLCGTVSMLVSNFFFGHGPYTPWQMFFCGIIGFMAGFLASKGLLKNRILLSLFGFAAGFVFGAAVDIFTVIAYTPQISVATVLGIYIAGFWFNVVLAAATAFFLYVAGIPIIKKLKRVQLKYGINEK
ncbi:MAG: ECF transporter S component [Firmicutes bacterium]|nr:ECF transporter S component [Bacillota bacterium]